MGEFKSFDEFLREQHGEMPQDPNDLPVFPLTEEERERQKKNEEKVLRRRARKARYQRYKRYCIAVSAALLVLVALLFLLPVPFGAVLLSGNEAVTEEDVLFEGNIRKPVNVLQVSASDLERRLKGDVRIASVTVTREFPFYIRVQMTERKPEAVIRTDFGFAFLDGEGFVTATVPALSGKMYPVITGKRLGNVLLGDVEKNGDVRKALLFISALSEEGRAGFSEVNIGNPDQITAYTREGLAVRLGAAEDMEKQAPLAEKMVSSVRAQHLNASYIDASNLKSPVIRLR